jgi:hypothetical protein
LWAQPTTKKKHLAPKILFAAAGGYKSILIFNGLLNIDTPSVFHLKLYYFNQ